MNRQMSDRRLTRRRGSTTLEAALILPILLGLTFASVELGYYLHVKHTFQGAAREGARVAALPDATNEEVTTAVRAAINGGGLSQAPYSLAIKDEDGNATSVGSVDPDEVVQVQVTCDWSYFQISPVGALLSNVTAGQAMRRE